MAAEVAEEVGGGDAQRARVGHAGGGAAGDEQGRDLVASERRVRDQAGVGRGQRPREVGEDVVARDPGGGPGLHEGHEAAGGLPVEGAALEGELAAAPVHEPLRLKGDLAGEARRRRGAAGGHVDREGEGPKRVVDAHVGLGAQAQVQAELGESRWPFRLPAQGGRLRVDQGARVARGRPRRPGGGRPRARDPLPSRARPGCPRADPGSPPASPRSRPRCGPTRLGAGRPHELETPRP